jgi:ComF family protein
MPAWATVNFWRSIQLTTSRLLLRWIGLAPAPPGCCLCGGRGELWQGPEPGLVGRWHQIPFDLCEYCLAALPRPVPAWTRAWLQRNFCDQYAALQYRYPVDHMIRQFKFSGDRPCGRVLATLLGRLRLSDRSHPLPAVIVPVPMHRSRFRERGIDHTRLLARWASEVCAVPVLEDWLVRVRATPPQSGLAAAARRHNVQGAFATRLVIDGSLVREPRHVALLDDVLITGSTLAAATAALRAAGVENIEHWVLARTAPTETLTKNILEHDADKHHEPGVAVLDKSLETLLGITRANQPLLAQKTDRQRA